RPAPAESTFGFRAGPLSYTGRDAAPERPAVLLPLDELLVRVQHVSYSTGRQPVIPRSRIRGVYVSGPPKGQAQRSVPVRIPVRGGPARRRFPRPYSRAGMRSNMPGKAADQVPDR